MSKNDSLNKKTMSNIIWSLAEKIGARGVTFIVSIILARLLDPTTYGLVALVTVITTILEVFVDCGLSEALIQKKDADELDFSSMFYFNVLICIFLYAVLYYLSPYIANFYKHTELTPVIRVLGLTVVVSGVKNIQSAYVRRNLIFKKFFFSTLIGTIVAAVIGISLAYKGYGVWALVIQHLTNNVVDTIILWITVKWRPKFLFSFNRLKELLNYGYKILFAALLNTIYENARSLIIGKMYTSADLAYYNQGEKYPKFAVDNVNSAIDSVLLTSMAKEQDDQERVKSMTRRAIKTSTFMIMPLMFGLIAISRPLIIILLTDKWIDTIPYFVIFCISYSFYSIHTANLNAIKALGRSDIFLKQEVVKKIVGFSVLIATMWFGPFVMALSRLLVTFLSLIINSYPNKKLLNYSYFEQLKDITPTIVNSLLMMICVYLISYLNINIYLMIMIQILTGAIIYVGISYLSKNDSFTYLLRLGKNYIKK